MNTSAQLKEQMIQEYISTIDFNKDYSVSKMKSDIKKILGEFPGIELDYQKIKSVNETTKKDVIVDELLSVTIGFSDGEDSLGRAIIHRFKYFI